MINSNGRVRDRETNDRVRDRVPNDGDDDDRCQPGRDCGDELEKKKHISFIKSDRCKTIKTKC